MLNSILGLIVLYYLVRTGDLFRIIKKLRKMLKDSMETAKTANESLDAKLDRESPVDILKLRLAKGEINSKEYEEIKANM